MPPKYEAQVGSLLLHNSLRERSSPDVQVMHFTHDYRSFRNVLGPIEKEWTADTIDMHEIVVSVGNILDSTDVRWTGALEPPDFVFSKCSELELTAPTVF